MTTKGTKDAKLTIQPSPKYRARKLKQTDEKGYEIIVVDCSKMADNINEIYKNLEKFIVVD